MNSRLRHGGHCLAPLEEAFGKSARIIVEIPVEAGSHHDALRGGQPEAVDIAVEQQQAGKALAAPGASDAELCCLLDGVDDVAASIGKADDLRLGSLCLHEVGGEVLIGEGMPERAEHLASPRFDEGSGIALERMPESVVDGDEEPGIATLLDHHLASPIGKRIG